jgi:hypothetical protein
MNDILFDPLIFVFESAGDSPGGTVEAYSFDGTNFDFSSSTGGGEISYPFIS